MGKVITLLALIFFAAAGLITFMALQLPAHGSRHQESGTYAAPAQEGIPEEAAPPAADVVTGEKEAFVEELQARIATLEENLARKEREDKGAQNIQPEGKERVLAVLGAGAFQSGQVVVEKDMVAIVKDLAPEIAASPDSRVLIEGHTDNIPIRSAGGSLFRDNIELSFLRAKAVADILTENGISPDRLSVMGHGDSRPIASNEIPEGRVINRRVEIRLIPAAVRGQ